MRSLMKPISRTMFLCLLLLSGCFTSTTPLLTADEGVTPFGDSFLAVPISKSGELKRDGSKPLSVEEFRRAGKQYRNVTERVSVTLTFVALDEKTPLYLVQLAGSDQSGHAWPSVEYAVVKPLDDTLDIYTPPEPGSNGLTAALKSAGFNYSATAAFQFSDKAQLLAAARIFSARLGEGSEDRYRIASSEEDRRILLARVAAVNSAANATSSATPPQTTPPQSVPDAGASTPNSCDQQAANPLDPGRMAPGVQFQSIIPALARQECGRAVSQFPNTARFVYQLGRAEEASGNPAAAIADYQKAVALNYPMALVNLGAAYENGTGVAADYSVAADYYRKAIAAGIDVRQSLQEVAFDPTGFSNPAFFQAVFEGHLSDIDPKKVSVYLGEFMQIFHNTQDCQDVVSTYALSRLLMNETFGTIGQMFGGLMQAHQDPPNGDFGRDAQSGWSAGMAVNKSLFMSVSDAQADAQLFYNREGCHSPVSRQFFHNIEALANAL